MNAESFTRLVLRLLDLHAERHCFAAHQCMATVRLLQDAEKCLEGEPNGCRAAVSVILAADREANREATGIDAPWTR